ncbi:MAG TPA: hypothetical protein VFQ61_15890, partial [Polyangiaceae bacterium]|nr:hypothetical protein [Polyangiaceae bacterium]
MALNRRTFLGAVPLCAVLAAACSGPLNSVTNTGLVELASTPSKGNDKTILVFMPKTPQTDEVWKGLTDELSEDYQLIAIQVESGPGAAGALGQSIDRYKPVALVLMNNPTVNAYHEYQQKNPNRKFPPAVVVMASFLEGLTAKLVSTTGVSYEVPLITAMTNFRRLIAL